MKIRFRSFDRLLPSCFSRRVVFAGYGAKFTTAFSTIGIYNMDDVHNTDEDVLCQLLAVMGEQCGAKAMDRSRVRKAFASAGAHIHAEAGGGRLRSAEDEFDQHTADATSATSAAADPSDRRESGRPRPHDRSHDDPRNRSRSRSRSRDRMHSRNRARSPSPARAREEEGLMDRLVAQNEKMMNELKAFVGVRVP